MPAPQKDGPRANRDIRGVREVQLIDDTGPVSYTHLTLPTKA